MQAVLDARLLANMAKELGRIECLPELDEEAESLCEQVNSLLWSEQDAFYYDLWRDGRQNGVKTIGAYWGLLADVVPSERIKAFIAHLENPEEFKRPNRIPSLSADHPEYDPNGGYWRGGVWAPTNYMVLKGLAHVGETGLAHQIAVKATPRNSRNRILRNGTMTKRTESPRLCSRKAHGFRPAGNACQPEPSSPARTAYSVWRSASAVLGIAFFGTGTAL